ncbi:hypothetical protein KIN20_034358 [Parelaphostrongylus tenuis]|uniref:Ran GTPase-activating protein 1 n=1 Tax=Parelaphostrongylus tenuis TaxID=148309 RepID=A0AAD5RCG5_PARTN|nr:hypothetical protein KIN20_034358 [Parelaphostrongylus tenuis]
MLSFLGRQLKMDSSEDAELVAKEIEDCDEMMILDLGGNSVGVEAGKRLAEAIATHPELERCLWSDLFTGRLKTETPIILRTLCSAMMAANCHITELDLSDNAFGPIGAEGISQFLVSPSAYSLNILKLNNNGLGAGGKMIASCLLECHRNAARDGAHFKLKTFIAGRNRLEDPGAKALAEAFTVLGSLEEISLPQNGIRAGGICALAKSFRSNPCLRVINLNDNTCSPVGALELTEGIRYLTKLEVLDLGDTLCKDAGVFGICYVISDGEHRKLKYVDLSGNQISADAALFVVEKWKETSIAGVDLKLKMSNNCFGSQFDDVLEAIEGTSIEIGEKDDDEGTLSVSSEEYDESEVGSEEYADDEEMSGDLDVGEQAAACGDKELSDLLESFGCIKFGNENKISTNDVVSFRDQQLKLDSAQDADLIVQRIEKQECMRTLELRGNTLGIESGKRIAQAIGLHSELQRCLWSDMFTGRLKDEIPPILKSLCSAMISANCHITELDLSDNAFGPVGVEGLREFLVSPAAFSLEVLKLNNNGLGVGSEIIAECLSECHNRSVKVGRPLKLKTFIAGRNRLEVRGAKAFAATFAKIKTLEELILPQNGITVEGIEALAECFVSNPNLRVVNLNDNTVTERGSDAIARALALMSKLEVLNLGDCLCRDQGCHVIVDSLSPKIHKSLKKSGFVGLRTEWCCCYADY